MLRSLAALLIFQCLGESVSCVFSLRVPGPVIGMLLLLFAFAMFRPSAAEAIELLHQLAKKRRFGERPQHRCALARRCAPAQSFIQQ